MVGCLAQVGQGNDHPRSGSQVLFNKQVLYLELAVILVLFVEYLKSFTAAPPLPVLVL